MGKFNSIEERNQDMQERGIADYTKAFTIVFRDRKKVFFEVRYGDLVSPTQDAYFATSAMQFNHIRSDWNSCGQAQESLLKRRALKQFFEKWDVKHCKSLTVEEYEDLIADIEELKEHIPYIETRSFDALVRFDRELSK